MFYLAVISISAALIALFNLLPSLDLGVGYYFLNHLKVLLAIAAVFSIDGIFAFISRKLPEKWFSPENKAFSVGKGERAFYRACGIKKWKKLVPEWGCFTGFHKDKLKSGKDEEYLYRFLLESNYGVAGHILGAVFGYLILLLPMPTLSLCLPVAVINMLLSLLPTAILRYNTPAILKLYSHAKKI